jgi:hypothetical protein
VYRLDGMAPSAAVAELLQDRFSPKHRASVTEFIAGTLYNEDRILPVHVTAPILNLRNGMLDLTTGILSHTTRTTCQQPSCPSPGILTRPARATSTG